MIDMTPVLLARSDQINAADLAGISRTVKIAGVKLTGKEQATEIRIADEPKVWRPNKNTVRIMSRAWGNDGEAWIGRSATLYCDPKVKFGKDTPGGIRISHLSGLRDKLTVCLQERKGVLKTYEIEPLQVAVVQENASDPADFIAHMKSAATPADLNTMWKTARETPDAFSRATWAALKIERDTLALALAKPAADDLDERATTGHEPSETLTLTIAEMQRQATEDGLESWLKRSTDLLDSFDDDDRRMFDAALTDRRKAWAA